MLPLTNGAPSGPPRKLATNQRYPNGVAVDEARVYWTNRGDGTVNWVLKGVQGSAPTLLASGQRSPGAIHVDARRVIWINEGETNKSNGAVLQIAKP
jgi:hypothetical protein